jgi:hypothetical protein
MISYLMICTVSHIFTHVSTSCEVLTGAFICDPFKLIYEHVSSHILLLQTMVS